MGATPPYLALACFRLGLPLNWFEKGCFLPEGADPPSPICLFNRRRCLSTTSSLDALSQRPPNSVGEAKGAARRASLAGPWRRVDEARAVSLLQSRMSADDINAVPKM